MAHNDLPLDLPHAGRIADRILNLLERHVAEHGIDAGDAVNRAGDLSDLLFRYSASDENPEGEEAMRARDAAAELGRRLVDDLEAAAIRGDRLGQYVRNLFECLELGEEGAAISLRAGESPNSLQRPI